MFVRFPPKVVGPSKEEMTFFQELDKRGRYVAPFDWTSNMSGVVVHSKIEQYHPVKFTAEELERALSLVGPERRLALHPGNANMGLSIGYGIGHIGVRPDDLSDALAPWNLLFAFIDRQMPEQYTFNRMSKIFMKPDNISILVDAGFEAPVNDTSKYDY